MPVETKIFETERLILRPTTLEDAPFILALLNSPKWLQFIGDRQVHSIEDAEKYIRDRMLSQYERLGFGNCTLITKQDGSRIGNCGLYAREGIDAVDIGFALLPEFEGFGYGKEAAEKLIAAAFEDFGQPKVGGIVVEGNRVSRRLLEWLGLTFEKNFRFPNSDEDLMYYSITSAQYHDIRMKRLTS